MSSAVTRCQYCGAMIRFIRTDRGRLMPCEADPMPFRQNMRTKGKDILITPEGHVIHCEIMQDGIGSHGYGFMPHFPHCPEYMERRRRGGTDKR